MGEHDRYWFRDLYDPTLLVPLIVKLPDAAQPRPRVVAPQVRLVDIAPTILDLLGVAPSAPFDGQSLAGLIRGDSDQSTGPAQSGLYYYPEEHYRGAHSVRHDGWKLIQRGAGWPGGDGPWAVPSRELYHLTDDPEERADLAESDPGGVTLDLEQHLEVRTPREVPLTPEERAQLRALGYVR